MTTIFISGSRNVPYLPQEVCYRIDKMIESDFDIIVGDSARGVDSAVLAYLFQCKYPNVSVYTVHGQPRVRTVMGNWNICAIVPEVEGLKDRNGNTRNSRELETYKDMAMGAVADFGLVIWQSCYVNRFGLEAASKGSLRNMHQLLELGKPVVLYRARECSLDNMADFELFELQSVGDLECIVEKEPDVVKKAYGKIEKQARNDVMNNPMLFE